MNEETHTVVVNPVEELERRRAEALAMGGEERIERHHASGRLTARERIALLVDEGSWREIGLLALPEIRRDAPSPGDAIVTGFGRIGAMCGARAWGVAPDLMAMAKGINSGYVPLGATLINERVASAFDKPGLPAALMHGYTYTGHPLACAAANANLEIVEAENLPARSLEIGDYLLQRLGEFTRYPHVGDVRGKGLMAAIELVADGETKEMLALPAPYVQALVATARSEGAIVRVQGNRLILSPPLVFSNADIDETVRVLHAAFQAAERA